MSRPSSQTRVWRHGLGRQLLMGFAALVMLVPVPVFVWAFFAVENSLGKLALALLLLAVGTLTAVVWGIFLAAIRTRIALDGTTLTLVLPSWRGSYPLPPFRRIRLDVGRVSAVEIREEASRALGMTAVSRALSLVTGTGERILVGFNAPNEVGGLPIDEIAAAIAAAAGRPITDRGIVDAGSQLAALFGGRSASWDAAALPAPQAERTRRAAARTWQIVGIAVALVALARACQSFVD